MPTIPVTRPAVPPFDRRFFDGTERFTCIGAGSFGGKAHSLLAVKDLLSTGLHAGDLHRFDVRVPTLTVVATDVFDRFMSRNGLWDVVASNPPDDRLALAFQAGDLPVELVGDLWALVQQVHTPLAVRSSSLLEDAVHQPFAGVYATKMLPNNQHGSDTRFRRLTEAIKLVYASTFFESARNYRRVMTSPGEDRMAVIIQAIVGRRRGDRFYPDLSGVARSCSFYRSGRARPQDGVVNLALGLGKTIVDGGISWSYSPPYPQATPPFASVGDLMTQTQTEFWAVNMGHVPTYDPVVETEYLVRGGLGDAEEDGVLRYLASTYDTRSDRLVPGVGIRGPRALTFAPLLALEEYPLNALVRSLLRLCADALGGPVEIEFAVTFPDDEEERAEFGFLQVRPVAAWGAATDVDPASIPRDELLLASDRVMGNGIVDTVRDIVYVRPEAFETSRTRAIATQLAALNLRLTAAARPYLLVGFGRWGSSDPWLGIPVEWPQINGARAIVEATLPNMNVEMSQGSHFFHNISSFEVSYFSVPFDSDTPIDWQGLASRPAEMETDLVRHLRLDEPLLIEVNGAAGLGAIRWRKPDA